MTAVGGWRRTAEQVVLQEMWVRSLRTGLGLDASVAVDAVREYLRAGALAAEDVDHLDRMSVPARREYLVARWPGRGVLVAEMLYVPPPAPVRAADPDRVTGLAA